MNEPVHSDIRRLPPISVPVHEPKVVGGPDHPMRRVTRQAAGLEPGEWNAQLRDQVQNHFDGLAGEWHARTSPERAAILRDALERGLTRGWARDHANGLAVEVGSGIGAYSTIVARHFRTVVAVDLSMQMLRRAPASPAHRVQADGSRLPVIDRSAAAVVLLNTFLFPQEVDRVLAPDGVVIWVSANGERTPIYLPPEDVRSQLPGEWKGTASRAGEGEWCVLERA